MVHIIHNQVNLDIYSMYICVRIFAGRYFSFIVISSIHCRYYFDFSEIDSHLSDTSSRIKFRNEKRKVDQYQMHNTKMETKRIKMNI